MFAGLPTELQLYLASLVLGVSLPLLVYASLHEPLGHFLHDIFASRPVETFWRRVVFLVIVGSGFGPAVGFHPDAAAATDYVAAIWNFADQTQRIVNGLWSGMAATMLPLLLSYTVLHAGRRRAGEAIAGDSAEPSASARKVP